jgi:hypothetical protein
MELGVSHEKGLAACVFASIRFDGFEASDGSYLEIRNGLLNAEALFVESEVDLVRATGVHLFSPWGFAKT